MQNGEMTIDLLNMAYHLCMNYSSFKAWYVSAQLVAVK